MAGQKRPSTISNQSEPVVRNQIVPQAGSSTETIPVASVTATTPVSYATSTATKNDFDTLNQIRVNTLGLSQGQANIFSAIDKSQGFFDLNFKSLGVDGDLKITETPTSIVLSLKQPDVTPTYIQSGFNLDQTGGRVYQGVNGETLQFRSIKVGPNLTLQETASSVVIGLGFTPSVGDIAGATNAGTVGSEIFLNKTGSNLNFRRLGSASNVLSLSLDSSGNQIIFTINENQINLGNLAGTLASTKITGLSALATNPDYNLLQNKPLIPASLSELSDVSIGTPTNGALLRYVTGTGWTLSTDAPSSSNAFTQFKVGPNSVVPNSPTSDVTFAAGDSFVVDSNTVSRTITYDLKPTGVTAGTYNSPTLIIDQYGRVTGATNGTGGGGSSYIDPMTNIGDLVYRNSANKTARLPAGSAGQVLTIVNGTPTWQALAAQSGGTVRSVGIIAQNGISTSGGPITESGAITIGLTETGAIAGQYANATVTVDRFGRVTNIIPGSAVPNIRKVQAANGLQGGGDLTADITLQLAPSGVVAGQYANALITVDVYGRVTAVAAGSGNSGSGTVTSVAVAGQNGINVTGGPITSSGTINVGLSNTGVQSGSYGLATFVVNAQGRITSVDTNNPVEVTTGVASTTGETIIDPDGGVYFQMFTTAEISSASHRVNTHNKDAGKCIINSTSFNLMIATGGDPTSAWVGNGGNPTITPA